MTRSLALLTFALSFSACDKSTDQTEAPDGGGTRSADGAEQTPPGAPDVPWPEKNHQQRLETMGLVVFPTMREAFQGHDVDRFGGFECQTCHGDDAKDVNYEMPNAVTPLAKDDPIADGNDIDEEITKFMVEVVLPKMKESLVGADVTCNSCHLEG